MRALGIVGESENDQNVPQAGTGGVGQGGSGTAAGTSAGGASGGSAGCFCADC